MEVVEAFIINFYQLSRENQHKPRRPISSAQSSRVIPTISHILSAITRQIGRSLYRTEVQGYSSRRWNFIYVQGLPSRRWNVINVSGLVRTNGSFHFPTTIYCVVLDLITVLVIHHSPFAKARFFYDKRFVKPILSSSRFFEVQLYDKLSVYPGGHVDRNIRRHTPRKSKMTKSDSFFQQKSNRESLIFFNFALLDFTIPPLLSELSKT